MDDKKVGRFYKNGLWESGVQLAVQTWTQWLGPCGFEGTGML